MHEHNHRGATRRGAVLTDAGSRLLDEARGVLTRFDDGLETMRRVKDGELGFERAFGAP